jgi:hypothetical protein
MVNPVRRPLAFSREGSHGALNPVFAAIRKHPLSAPQAPIEVKLHTGQAAGLSNGVKGYLLPMDNPTEEFESALKKKKKPLGTSAPLTSCPWGENIPFF